EIRGADDPVASRHLDIDQGDLWPGAKRGRKHLVPATDLGDYGDVDLTIQNLGQRLPEQGLVLREHDRDHAQGISTWTRKPPAALLPPSPPPPPPPPRSPTPSSPLP